MDPRRFDALVRSLVVSASRRRVLAGLLPALLPALGSVRPEEAAAAKRRAAKRKRRDKAKDKATKKKAKQRKQTRAEAAPGCCKSGNCTAGTGKNLTRCCFENQTLTKKSFKGSNLTEVNFTGATLTKANFASTNLTRACFVDADITGANFKSANLSGVVFCRTTTGSGEDNSGCDRGSPCCPTCTSDTQCGDGRVCCDGTCQDGELAPQARFGTAGDGDDEFNGPVSVAVAPDTLTVWVVDYPNHRISVWTRPNAGSTDWDHHVNFGTEGDGDDEFHFPTGVAVSPDTKTVWVVDTFNHRISVWSRPDAHSTDWAPVPSGHFGTEGDGDNEFSFPGGVAIAPDTLTVWVADTNNHRISIWTRTDADSTDWEPQARFGTPGVGDDEFNGPGGVAISPDTLTIWVADVNNNRISVWSRTDAGSDDWDHQANFGTAGPGDDEFALPTGVAVAPDTLTVWVADSNNNRISVWSRSDADSDDWAPVPNGHFGAFGDGADEFNGPAGVAVDPDTLTVWVADIFNARVSVWGLACPAS